MCTYSFELAFSPLINHSLGLHHPRESRLVSKIICILKKSGGGGAADDLEGNLGREFICFAPYQCWQQHQILLMIGQITPRDGLEVPEF